MAQDISLNDFANVLKTMPEIPVKPPAEPTMTAGRQWSRLDRIVAWFSLLWTTGKWTNASQARFLLDKGMKQIESVITGLSQTKVTTTAGIQAEIPLLERFRIQILYMKEISGRMAQLRAQRTPATAAPAPSSRQPDLDRMLATLEGKLLADRDMLLPTSAEQPNQQPVAEEAPAAQASVESVMIPAAPPTIQQEPKSIVVAAPAQIPERPLLNFVEIDKIKNRLADSMWQRFEPHVVTWNAQKAYPYAEFVAAVGEYDRSLQGLEKFVDRVEAGLQKNKEWTDPTDLMSLIRQDCDRLRRIIADAKKAKEP